MVEKDWIAPDGQETYANDRQREVVEYLLQKKSSIAVRLLQDGDIELLFIDSQYSGLPKFVAGKAEQSRLDPYRIERVYAPDDSEISLKVRLTVDEVRLEE